MRLPSFVALLATVTITARAYAQSSTADELLNSTFDPDNAVAPISYVEGPGWKVGEGTTLHPVVGAETGFVSNVFYQQNNPVPAGVLRVLAQIGVGSLQGLRFNVSNPDASGAQGDWMYRATVALSYDQMLSDNSAANDTGGLGASLLLRGLARPLGPWTFGVDEQYQRLIRAANFETDANTNRDLNTLELNVLWHPRDRALSGALYLNNTFDIFERGQQNFADRVMGRVGLRPMWRPLPQTLVFADLSWGVTTGLGSTPGVPDKVTSYPLLLLAGIATLLTPNITAQLQGGYTKGFYQQGPDFSSFTGAAAVGWRYSPLGRALLSYNYLFNDSVNANFYRDHVFALSVQHLVEPFVILVQPELHFREYDGVIVMPAPGSTNVRDDTIVAVVAGVHYIFRNSFAITLDYKFTDVSTDFQYVSMGPMGTVTTNPSYIRHELLAGVRWAP